jgi:hypothetical protein
MPVGREAFVDNYSGAGPITWRDDVRSATLARLIVGMLLVVGLTGCGTSAQGAAAPTATPPAPTQAPEATEAPEPNGAATATAAAVDPLPTPLTQQPVVVRTPEAQARVSSPLTVSGEATVYEGTVRIQVVSADGQVLGQGFTTATMGAPVGGTFSAQVEFTPPEAEAPGIVRVFGDNPRTGEPDGLVEIPVTLLPAQ